MIFSNHVELVILTLSFLFSLIALVASIASFVFERKTMSNDFDYYVHRFIALLNKLGLIGTPNSIVYTPIIRLDLFLIS